MSDFFNWLAGFIDGEGCFHGFTQPNGTPSFNFTLNLRRDDKQILVEIEWRTGLGTVRDREAYTRDGAHGRSPQAIWRVAKLHECLSLIQILDAHPLRAKKKRDYAVWREGVFEWERIRNTGGVFEGGKDWSRAAQLVDLLRATRAYSEPTGVLDADEYERSLLDAWDAASGAITEEEKTHA